MERLRDRAMKSLKQHSKLLPHIGLPKGPHQIIAGDSNLVQIPDIRTQPRLQTRERERDTRAKGSPQRMEVYADTYDRAIADFMTARINKRNSINM